MVSAKLGRLPIESLICQFAELPVCHNANLPAMQQIGNGLVPFGGGR
jgi:hypothetical protein